MNDREALLAAIDANPGEDTPRLAYADFLEESGAVEASDLDKATVEFIKVACGKELQKHRQSVTEGRWLEQNWRRLVPSPVLHQRYKPRRNGRWMNLVLETRHDTDILRHFVRLEFWRGFVRHVWFESPFDLDGCLPTLAADQPLLKPDLDYWPGTVPRTEIWVLSYAEIGLGFHFARGTEFADDDVPLLFHHPIERPGEPIGIESGNPLDAAHKARRAAYARYARWLFRHGYSEFVKKLSECSRLRREKAAQGAAEPPPQEAA